jgi:hypothetical protein
LGVQPVQGQTRKELVGAIFLTIDEMRNRYEGEIEKRDQQLEKLGLETIRLMKLEKRQSKAKKAK